MAAIYKFLTIFRGIAPVRTHIQASSARLMSSRLAHLEGIARVAQNSNERPNQQPKDTVKSNETEMDPMTQRLLSFQLYKMSVPPCQKLRKYTYNSEPPMSESLRLDDTEYKHIEQNEREYVQTWKEFPSRGKKENRAHVYDSKDDENCEDEA